jgi:hypothetical protein
MSSAGYNTKGVVTSWFSDSKGTVRLLKNLRVTFPKYCVLFASLCLKLWKCATYRGNLGYTRDKNTRCRMVFESNVSKTMDPGVWEGDGLVSSGGWNYHFSRAGVPCLSPPSTLLIFLEIRALSRSSSSSHNRSDRGQPTQITDLPEGTDKKGKETDQG